MASIVPKKGKTGLRWQASVRRKGHPNVHRTFRRKADAERWARKVEAKVERGEFVAETVARQTLLSELVAMYTNRAPQVDAAGDLIVDRYGEPVLGGNPDFGDHPERDRAKTIAKLDWWVEALGAPTLDRLLDGRLIRDALVKLRAGAGPSGRKVSPATANRYRAAIRSALSYAVDHRMIPTNPAKGMKAGREVARVRRLDNGERKRLLEACKQASDGRLYPMVVLALASGGRQGELMKLRWSDVDFERARVQFLDTKNREHRGIGISPGVLAVLRERLVRVVGDDHLFAEPGRVKSDESAKTPLPRFPRAAWEWALREAEIEDFRFHDCRHDFASRLAESGATLAELAEALGHRTLAMVKRYSHLTEGHVADVTRRASEALL